MKALICTSLIVASVSISMVQAVDLMGDGALRVLMDAQKPHSQQGPNESFNTGNPLNHAESKGSVTSLADELGNADPAVDLGANNKDILGNAVPANEVRDELRKQEAFDDQKYGVMSGQGANEDESLKKAPFDLKWLNPNPQSAVILDQAQVATAI